MDGIIYSAIGDRYLAEALTSARSSLRFNHVPHQISTDQEVTPADTDPDELSIRTYRPGDDAFAEKIHSMAASPFERSIFLDTDTYVTNYICHLFDLLDKYDMAAAFAPGYRGRKDPEVPTAFYELNTGVIVWRSGERTASFFADWLDTYVQMTRERPFTRCPAAGSSSRPFAGARGDTSWRSTCSGRSTTTVRRSPAASWPRSGCCTAATWTSRRWPRR